jgi:NB-ARC domain
MTPPASGENGRTPNPSAARGSRRLRAVESVARAGPAPRALERPACNLPLELSSFVGRGREVVEAKDRLTDDRLLTLTGPGGCGKTRLALAVASEVVEGFEDGAWWVALTSLSDPTLVPQAVASALGVREIPSRSLTEVLMEHLETKNLLLILDKLRAPHRRLRPAGRHPAACLSRPEDSGYQPRGFRRRGRNLLVGAFAVPA